MPAPRVVAVAAAAFVSAAFARAAGTSPSTEATLGPPLDAVVVMANRYALSAEADAAIHRLLDDAFCDALE